ncbi:GIY-YIG nuclease family protein, partial [Vibrio sp. 10N.222.55.C6]
TDAPSLEKELHRVFDNDRLNMVNRRKEFFQVELSDIKKAVKNFDIDDAEFIETAVAQDFNETKAMRKQAQLKEAIELGATTDLTQTKQPEFAESI